MCVFCKACSKTVVETNSKSSGRTRNCASNLNFPLGLWTSGFRVLFEANSKVNFPLGLWTFGFPSQLGSRFLLSDFGLSPCRGFQNLQFPSVIHYFAFLDQPKVAILCWSSSISRRSKMEQTFITLMGKFGMDFAC